MTIKYSLFSILTTHQLHQILYFFHHLNINFLLLQFSIYSPFFFFFKPPKTQINPKSLEPSWNPKQTPQNQPRPPPPLTTTATHSPTTTIARPDHKSTNQQIYSQPQINLPTTTHKSTNINHKSTKSTKNQTQINPNHKPDLDLVSLGLDLVLLRRDFNR